MMSWTSANPNVWLLISCPARWRVFSSSMRFRESLWTATLRSDMWHENLKLLFTSLKLGGQINEPVLHSIKQKYLLHFSVGFRFTHDTVTTLQFNSVQRNEHVRETNSGQLADPGVRTNYFTLVLLYFESHFRLKKELHRFLYHHQLSDLIEY